MNVEHSQVLILKEEIKTEPNIDIPCLELNKDVHYDLDEEAAKDAVYVGNTLYKAYEVKNGESFNQSTNHYEQLLTDLPGNGEHVFECPLCYYTTGRKKNLKKHLRRHETLGKKHMCGLCGHRTVSSEQMVKHLQTHTKKKQTFACSYCLNFQGTSARFRKHMKTVHNDYWPFKCNVCSSGFRLYRSLSVHLASHDDSSPSSKKAPTKRLIEKHRKLCHRKEKSFKCSQCDYACENRTTFKIHMRKHTGERPFKCDYCDKYRAASMNTLRIHLCQHTGERRYKCSSCSYTTIQRHPYKVHLQKHLNQDPLGCWLCTFRTAKIKHLKSHQHLHNSHLVCFYCQLTFERHNLKKHILDEHGGPDSIPVIDATNPDKDPLA